MQLTEQQLNKYMDICKEYYPDIELSKEDALEDALKLLDLIKTILQVEHKN